MSVAWRACTSVTALVRALIFGELSGCQGRNSQLSGAAARRTRPPRAC